MVLGKRLNGFTGVLAGGYVIYQKKQRNAHVTSNSLNFNGLQFKERCESWMGGNLARFITGLILCLSLSAFLSLPTSYAQEQTYTITETQLTELESTYKMDESRLMTLETKLKVLTQNSTEQEKSLTEALEQLNEVKNLLIEARQSLKSANVSLTNAKATIAKLEESLTMLEEQVKTLQHQRNLAKRQRNVWCFVAAGFGSLAIYEATN